MKELMVLSFLSLPCLLASVVPNAAEQQPRRTLVRSVVELTSRTPRNLRSSRKRSSAEASQATLSSQLSPVFSRKTISCSSPVRKHIVRWDALSHRFHHTATENATERLMTPAGWTGVNVNMCKSHKLGGVFEETPKPDAISKAGRRNLAIKFAPEIVPISSATPAQHLATSRPAQQRRDFVSL
jgi:hypothetical protein